MTAHLHRAPSRMPWWVRPVWVALVGIAVAVGAVLALHSGPDRPRPAGVVHTAPAAPAAAERLVTPSPWPSAASRWGTRTALPGGGR